MRNHAPQVMLVPSAFTVPTGKAHWEVLLRARAIENQAFVIAAAQVNVGETRVLFLVEFIIFTVSFAVYPVIQARANCCILGKGDGVNRVSHLIQMVIMHTK